LEYVVGRGSCRYYGDVAVVVHQQAQDVLLDAEIVGHHAEPPGPGRRSSLTHLFAPGRRGIHPLRIAAHGPRLLISGDMKESPRLACPATA
jgi:hypothetical protein